ncbi:MAG TPA: hypothetical protein PK303_04965 [bacterium]|nr:hypothetical protein [bacterium]HOL34486.1 hypothetical protein [bacterium]HPP08456.1 hypothetical protein [bacterium]
MGKNKKSGKKSSGKLILIIALLILAGGAYIGYNRYQAYQKQLAEQKAKEEQLRKQQLAEEQKRKELEEAKQKFEDLLSQMRQALAKKDYAGVRQLAEKARELALAYKFSTDEIEKILKEMNLAMAMAELSRLEKINDPYAYLYVRNRLKKIPRYPEIAKRWDKLWKKSFQNEYLVLLDLAENTSSKVNSGDSPEINYLLSKTYLKRAKAIAALGRAIPDKERENALLQKQSDGYFSSIGRSFQPVGLYR